jgi:hypothetical protein
MLPATSPTRERHRKGWFLLVISYRFLETPEPSGAHYAYRDLSEPSHLVLHGPCIEIADSTHAPNSLGTIVLRTKFAAKVADVEVDASIERRELPVKYILYECLTGQNLSWRFEKCAQ